MTPTATYRLQFRQGMTFDSAVELVPYLQRLGISHLYASPIARAPVGSTHGYDVADHNEIDPALGGREGFERLSRALKGAGLGLILDIVPNHMAASLENPWWRSVVEWGEQSPFARHFDIDWRGRLTLPILGGAFEEVAGRGEVSLRVDAEQGVLALSYFETLLPLSPATYRLVLDRLSGPLAAALGETAAGADPHDPGAFHERNRCLFRDPGFRALALELERQPAEEALLRAVHDAQPWELMHWKAGRERLSYRRFFEVTGLAGVRVEDHQVFDDVHRLVLELVRGGQVDGLRVDHVDGLADPKAYLARLRREIGPDAYLVVEKILAAGETLPKDWPVQGTTGYEFIADMASLLVDPEGETELDRAYLEVTGATADFVAAERLAKTMMVRENFLTELRRLVAIAAAAPEAAALGKQAIEDAIAALVLAFPVYRTYGDRQGLSPDDRTLLHGVIERAREADPGLDRRALATVATLLQAGAGEEPAAQFRLRFQQLTGPVTAKAVEDTMFYRVNRLIGLNEVGGDPARFGAAREEVFASIAERGGRWPDNLLATATHDTKRGEDARARLYAISEAPALWAEGVARWRTMNVSAVSAVAGAPAPEPETEWMIYQALGGLWPEATTKPDPALLSALEARFMPYLEKALREAKLRTSWTEVNSSYEGAVKAYAEHLFSPASAFFHRDFSEVLAPFARAGSVNSLTQTLFKLAAPGVPDIYQGTEWSDFSLVDPDNRRPIDFTRLEGALRATGPVGRSTGGELGRQKLGLIAAGLALRRRHPEVFAEGSLEPLAVEGPLRRHVVAFARALNGRSVIAVGTRRVLRICGAGAWSAAAFVGTSVRLPAGWEGREWLDVVSTRSKRAGERLDVSEVLEGEPAALLFAG